MTEYKLSFPATEIDRRLSLVGQLFDAIGDLESLETSNKDNLVAAINSLIDDKTSGLNTGVTVSKSLLGPGYVILDSTGLSVEIEEQEET